MKRPIAWHKEGLKNMRATMARYEMEFKQAQERWIRIAAEVAIRDTQIKRAEAEGRDGFDGDKYLRRRSDAKVGIQAVEAEPSRPSATGEAD